MSVKNKKTIKRISFLVVVFAIIAFISTSILNLATTKNIEYVLKSEHYSYLPLEAKNYIKEVYEESGEVILTEKNKEENKPYLNPEYVEYLELEEEEQEKLDLVPNVFVVDYTVEQTTSEELPSKYNLSNVGGNNFLTPFKNQGSLGLCWSFASLQQAESYLMVKNNESYTELSDKFSIRQMDYATSNNGIKNYENETGYRAIGSGGNFYMSSMIMSYGLTMIDDNLMPYDGVTKQKELIDVLNFSNSKYELDSTIMMPIIASDASDIEKESYINVVKENIIKYGGAYVGTGSPSENCGFKNTDGTYAMVDADNCVGTSGHAMQIIGWDDDYSYSYCKSGSNHLSVNDNGTCDSGTLVSNVGAWILRNSWGEESSYKYVYLGYSSYGLDINFTTSLNDMSSRIWDNVYHKNIWTDGTVDAKNDTVAFIKDTSVVEKVEKVKFMPVSINGSYTISIETQNTKYEDIKTVNVDYPGIYTIDLSDKNITLDSSDFKVIIKSDNDTYILSNTISVFTSNVGENPIIQTENLDGNAMKINSNSNYEFIAYSKTRNIPSNSVINYALFKGTEDYSDYIVSISDNKVAINNINSDIVLNNELPVGTYTLQSIYNNNIFESTIVIPSIYSLEGEGTEENPYLLYNEEDLNQIRYDLDAYYLLKNDITLTEEWIPIGTYANPFMGGFDGGNNSISGLVINSRTEDSVGFFGYVDGKYSYDMQTPQYIDYNEKTYIKNITFNNAQVSNHGNAGILIGQLTFDPNKAPETAFNVGAPSLTIDSVHFVGGSVNSLNGDAGVIAANINIVPMSWRQPYLTVNNMYSSVSISGKHSAGLIGYINDSYESGSGIMLDLEMSNFQNVGVLRQSLVNSTYTEKNKNNYSPVVGGLYGNAKFTLSNYIINSIFDDVNYTGEFFYENTYFFLGGFDSTKSKNLKYSLSNGYYVSRFGSDRKDGFVTASEITDETLYEEWEDFSTYWEIKIVDDITRLPVLKGINYNYTSVSDIDLKLYDKVSLLDYIEGNPEYQYVSFEIITNDKVVDIDYTFTDESKENKRYYDNYEITALNKGTAIVRITNEYDGFEKEININVTADKVTNPIITYYFDGKDNAETYTQTLNALETFNLTQNQFHKLGYKFKEWNTISDGTGTSYSDGSLVEGGIDENLRLYAQWELIKYTIKFDANGGIGSMNDRLAYINNNILLTANTFTREGYTFTGWNTKADGTGISYANRATLKTDENLVSSIDGEIITLYAQWEEIKYNITFNSNDGSNSTKTQQIKEKTEEKLTTNTFTREGYTFTGWNTKADGTGTSYSDGQTVVLTNDLTLYAQWKIKEYTITFNSNDGNGYTTTQVLEHNQEKVLTTNTFTREGYTFTGWNTKADGTGTSYSDGQTVVLTNDLTLYAQWEEGPAYIIKKYVIDEGNKYIDLIDINTSVDEFKKNIEVNTGYTVEVDYKSVNGKNVLYTGGKTKIYKNDELIVEYTNIIRGDVNGNGAIDIIDYIRIMKDIMDTTKLTGVYIKAADVNQNQKIDIIDYIRIMKMIMEEN